MADTHPGQVPEQEHLSFYADREVIYYKQFVENNALRVDKIEAAGFNARQIPVIYQIAVEQGWLKPDHGSAEDIAAGRSVTRDDE